MKKVLSAALALLALVAPAWAQDDIEQGPAAGIAGGPPTGTAGGDLTGSFPNPTLNLANAHAWTGQQYFATQALTFVSGGTTWNYNMQCDGTLAPTASFTLSNPTNMQAGSTCTLTVTQDGTGGRIITYGSAYKFPGGAKFVLSTTASAVDILTCHSPDGTSADCVGQPAFQ